LNRDCPHPKKRDPRGPKCYGCQGRECSLTHLFDGRQD
jgi:hypothetical protein